MSSTTDPAAPDGRSARWEAHRAARRADLVEATVRAIRRNGATVGMDDIAAMAGTSKTVFYRHFTDRAGLYAAVAEHVDARIMRDLLRSLGSGAQGLTDTERSPRDLLSAAIDSYLRMVEDDPEVYKFIVAAPLVPPGETEVAPGDGVSAQIAHQIGALIADSLEALGRDPAPAQTWGQAVVGMVRASGDHWLRSGRAAGMPREVLREQLTTLIWGGLSSAWPSEP